MKKTIICGIPMKEPIDKVVYTSGDKSIPVADNAVRYPINAFLKMTAVKGDIYKVVLILKADAYSAAEQNLTDFQEEFLEAISSCGASAEFYVIRSDYDEARDVHEKLLGGIVEEISVGSKILVDLTYGPKDLPIIIFTALSFAEKFLDCEIENIIYGQASFLNGRAVNTRICDMVPLYYLGSVTNTIGSGADPVKAKSMLKALLSI
jgi:CRISPR-associated protein (cas_TM1812).